MIKKQFNKIKQYLNTFNLKLRISKCTYVINQKNCNFMLKSKHNEYLYDKEPNHTFTYLGITTSINLDTDNHWEPIESKFEEMINKIIKSPTSISEKAFLANITQIILTFGVSMLPTSTKRIRKWQFIIDKGIKKSRRLSKSINTNALRIDDKRERLGLKSIEDNFDIERISNIIKIMDGQTNNYKNY
jgi:hypothetical protein